MTSAKPTVLSAQARALANENTTPIGPPISGPSVREIMKYAPPKQRRRPVNPVYRRTIGSKFTIKVDMSRHQVCVCVIGRYRPF